MRPGRRPKKAFVVRGQAFHPLLQDRFTAWRRRSEAQGRRERAAFGGGSGGRRAAGEAGGAAPDPLPGPQAHPPCTWGLGGRGHPRAGPETSL